MDKEPNHRTGRSTAFVRFVLPNESIPNRVRPLMQTISSMIASATDDGRLYKIEATLTVQITVEHNQAEVGEFVHMPYKLLADSLRETHPSTRVEEFRHMPHKYDLIVIAGKSFDRNSQGDWVRTE